MRYILDSEGYIEEVIFTNNIECREQICVVYTGSIPNGYDSLNEWANTETAEQRLNAWKIVDGNLVFDTVRQARLERQFASDEEKNTPATHEWVEEFLFPTKKQVADQYASKITDYGVLFNLKETKNLPVNLTIKPYSAIADYIRVIATTKNVLTNEAIADEISGVDIAVNEDRSITLNGTSTARIDFDIAGTNTNTTPLMALKKGYSYYLSSNSMTIKLYSYDGTDRTEVYSGTGGAITTTEDKPITQIVLVIPTSTTYDDETIYLQLEIGTEATDYVSNEYNKLDIDLQDYTFTKSGVFVSDTTIISNTLKVQEEDIDYITLEDNILTLNKDAATQDLGSGSLSLFDNESIIYPIQDVYMQVNYKLNYLGGSFMGNVYDPDGAEMVGHRGLISNLQFTSTGTYNGYSILGFNTGPDSITGLVFHYSDVSLDIEIPKNFVVIEAYITLFHLPAYWHGANASTETNFNVWGYARNVELYKINGNKDYYFEAGYNSSFYTNNTDSDNVVKTEIANAMGENGFTGKNSQDNVTEVFKSNNIANAINSEGRHKLILRTSDDIPTGIINNVTASEKSALGKAILNVYGYMKYEKESE